VFNTSRPPVASLIIVWNLPNGPSTDHCRGVAPASVANVQVITLLGSGVVDGVGVCEGVGTGDGVGTAAVHPTIHKTAINNRVKGTLTKLRFMI
jgi:hypothetical protein